MELYDNQKIISSNIYNSLDKKELFNVPTGAGKTFILLDVARKLVNDGQKVIISAPTNQLVRESYKTAIEQGFFNADEISIKIGADNYIDRDRLLLHMNSELIFEYIENSKEDLEKFMEESEELFFDIFDEFANYKDQANKNILKEMITKKTSKGMELFDDVTITNHFYLISKTMHNKSFDISKYVVLIDEVHQIAEVAESILNEKFSYFEFKNMLHNIKSEFKDIDFKGRDSFFSNIKNLSKRVSDDHRRLKNENLTGVYIQGYKNNEESFDSVISLVESKQFKSCLSKICSLSKLFEISSYKKQFMQTRDYVNKFKTSNKGYNCGVYYSPSLGYPNLTLAVANPLGMLNSMFWKKIQKFAGLSATTTSSFRPSFLELKYAYERLGLVEKERKDYDVHFYNRIFPKEQVKIYLPEVSNIKIESVYDKDFVPFESEYYNQAIKKIHDTNENKNSIVICGGYKEAKYLFELYLKTYGDKINIDYAKPTEKTYSTVERFKKNGGILFAVRNYNTGISIEKEQLEKLYILKFPFVDFTSKKWQELKSQSEGKFAVRNEREMYITLMQTLGRLQRTKDDRGDIYILDGRYHSFPSKRKKAIMEILREYGLLIDEEEQKKAIQAIKIKEELEDELEKLLIS